ncbi:MAG: subclass B3 metallo-beta-lactamase [Proteobacteria bacterium]|nr:subclass B3 metallo-beta-lactamase [Pseudomonadota bacterium]
MTRPGLAAVTLLGVLSLACTGTALQANATAASPAAGACPRCAEWAEPQAPFRIYGNTYYVGTHGLSSILVTSAAGHILIDGTLAEAAPQILANIRALGFRAEDVRLILNSHVHFDHAGGIAAIQRATGAVVAASASSAQVLRDGHSGPDDPQYGSLPRGPDPVPQVRTVRDGETVAVGPLALTAHFTPGHTPGGTTWSWRSCEAGRCLDIVYADSLGPLAAPAFRFTASATYPSALADFEHSFEVLAQLPCDILLTPHPDVSDTFGRLQRREDGSRPDAFIDAKACRDYAARGRASLAKRLAEERVPAR